MPMDRRGKRWWLLLLVIPWIALLSTPLYSRMTPAVRSFPFFYWFQFLWIPLSAAITYLVYRKSGR